jgi:hypothetical protein
MRSAAFTPCAIAAPSGSFKARSISTASALMLLRVAASSAMHSRQRNRHRIVRFRSPLLINLIGFDRIGRGFNVDCALFALTRLPDSSWPDHGEPVKVLDVHGRPEVARPLPKIAAALAESTRKKNGDGRNIGFADLTATQSAMADFDLHHHRTSVT